MKTSNGNDTIKVNNVQALQDIVKNSKGHRGIVAASILEAGSPCTKGAVLDLASPRIEATPQKTVQGGNYVTRYYLSELKGAGLIEVIAAPKPKAEGAVEPAEKKPAKGRKTA